MLRTSHRNAISIFLGFHSFVKTFNLLLMAEKPSGISEYGSVKPSLFQSCLLLLILIHLLTFYFFGPSFDNLQ